MNTSFTRTLTPWFPPEIKPVRQGWYDTRFPYGTGSIARMWWHKVDGWGYDSTTNRSTTFQYRYWRGLASDPNAKADVVLRESSLSDAYCALGQVKLAPAKLDVSIFERPDALRRIVSITARTLPGAPESGMPVVRVGEHNGGDYDMVHRTSGVDTTCEWTEEDPWGNEPGTYDSACGERWSFIDGGPKENNVRFCQGCGKSVKVIPFPEHVDEEDESGVQPSDGETT